MRILIIKPSSLGDIFHVFPAVALLRKQFPDAKIDWLVHTSFSQALDYCPGGVENKIPFHRRHLSKINSFFPYAWQLWKDLRQHKYDYVFDFQGLTRSGICAWIARSDKKIGWKNPREAVAARFYNIKVDDANSVHAVDRNLVMVQKALNLPPVSIQQLDLALPEVERFADPLQKKFAHLHISPEDRIVGIVPGARWHTKRFPHKLFAQIITQIHQQDPAIKFLLLGSNDDVETGRSVRAAVDDAEILSLIGRTHIGEMVEAVRRCSIIISNDTGPIHLAAIFNIPVFALFGPTDPDKTGPYGTVHKVYQASIPCCKCMERYCPLSAEPDCHKLDWQTIANDAIEVLEQQKRAAAGAERSVQ